MLEEDTKYLTILLMTGVISFNYIAQPFVEVFDFGKKNEIKNEQVDENHISTPKPLKAIYMTNWVAGTKNLKEDLIDLINETELNAVVIDIKDYSGRIGYKTNNNFLNRFGSSQNRIADIENLIDQLHGQNIYVIGRISVFQDSFLANKYPKYALKKKSSPNELWLDHKGIAWLDPSSTEVWDYIVKIGEDAYLKGFDELNFDYIRFPSDGNLSDILYKNDLPKEDVIESFFIFLDNNFKNKNVKLSADLFGLVTVAQDDLNIGQVLEKALPYFDYISPMVYPSHYRNGWRGYQNPAKYPYEVVYESLKMAKERAIKIGEDPNKIRPWLQDFNLGAIYTKEMIRKQINAVYSNELDSWMIWNARNKYTEEAFLKE
jgi:hypothetical protein